MQQTTNLLDEAERALLQGETLAGRDSNLLDSYKHDEVSGQRELDSDEMDEELMDEHNLVQPGWKISDESSPDTNAKAQQRAGWAKRESVIVKPPAEESEETKN